VWLRRPVVGRAPHPERRVRRLGVVVIEPATQLRQDGFGVPELGSDRKLPRQVDTATLDSGGT